MHQITHRPNRIPIHELRSKGALAVAATLSSNRTVLEHAFLFFLVSALWGFVIYTALSSL